MNCDDVNSRLIELVYGELEPALAARCREHAAACSACGAALAALEQTQQVLDALPPRQTRVDLARLCLKTVQRQQQVRSRVFWGGAGAAAAALAAAGLFVAAVRVEVAPGHLVLALRAAGDAAPPGGSIPGGTGPRLETPHPLTGEADERLAANGALEDAAPATVSRSFARIGRFGSESQTYLATRDRVLALGLDSLQRASTGPVAAQPQMTAPATYQELRRELLDPDKSVHPRM